MRRIRFRAADMVEIREYFCYYYKQLYTTKFTKFIQDARTSASRCSVQAASDRGVKATMKQV